MEPTVVDSELLIECTPSELPGFPEGNREHGIGKIFMPYEPLKSKLEELQKAGHVEPLMIYPAIAHFVDRTESLIYQGKNLAARFDPIGNKLDTGGILELSLIHI